MNAHMDSPNKVFKDLVTTLKIIGSPFTQRKEKVRIEAQEIPRLYALAKNNKVGLFLLESVSKSFSEIDRSINLNDELVHQRFLRSEQRITVEKTVGLLEHSKTDFVVVKTIADFPYVASDVDLLIMGNEKSYNNAVDVLLRSGFVEVEHAKLQNCFHDSTRAVHVARGKKDVYDVDLYQEMSASYLIYLDKRLFDSMIDWKRIDHIDLPVLKPEAELLLVIFHSIYPEQLYTLYHYYTIIHLLRNMGRKSLNDFLELARKQYALYPIRLALIITASLHHGAHGFVPSGLLAVLNALNVTYEPDDSILLVPYRYKIADVFLALGLKLRERLFRESVKKQIKAMVAPSYLDYVLKVSIDRRVRETY